MHQLVRPAVAMFGRLRYAYKILVVPLLLLVPLGIVTTAYLGVQRGQIAFSALERDGAAYLGPLLDLTARTVDARRLAVSGEDPSRAGVAAAVAPVEAVERRHGAALETSASWRATKAALAGAAKADRAGAFAAYTSATTQLLGLIVLVSDKSNLTLDPDLDSYYLMDTAVFRLPILLDTAGQAIDRVALADTPQSRDAARIELAIGSGALSTTLASVDAGMATAFAKTASPSLPGLEPQVRQVHDTVNALLEEVKQAITSGELGAVTAATADAARGAVTALATALMPELDALLQARIGGLETDMYLQSAVTVLTLLVAGYLLIGFCLSVTAPLCRMLDAIDRLATGDLTGQLPVDTRDEVGHMAAALNRSTAQTRTAIEALAANATRISAAARNLTDVSARMLTAADRTAHEAGGAGTSADQTSASIAAVATSAQEMSAAIGEISRAATDAAAVTGQAVGSVGVIESAVGRLGESSDQIGAVVKVISGIAAQTNLLALNATIEAARAGDAGKGFAVVADEVKTLAQETARATEDIIGKVNEIQAGTAAAVDSIGDITSVIGHINGFQETIASAVEEQTTTTAEIGRVISDAAGGSGRVAASVRAVAATAEVARGGAASTEHAAQELAGTSAELESIVARFTVR